jgi:hypothetical protein
MDASLVMFFFFICMFFLVIRHLRKAIKNGDPLENEWDCKDSHYDDMCDINNCYMIGNTHHKDSIHHL